MTAHRDRLAILLLPLVAGLAYEVTVKWAGNHSNNPFVKVLLWPGMQLQRMTTREPDDSMVEVAVAAMKPIIAREERRSDAAASDDGAVGAGDDEPSAPTREEPADARSWRPMPRQTRRRYETDTVRSHRHAREARADTRRPTTS